MGVIRGVKGIGRMGGIRLRCARLVREFNTEGRIRVIGRCE
jgi:hypothetical protein